MLESSSESFSTQQIQQARYRVAPLSVKGFIEGVPVRENPEILSKEKVEEQCFAALGYMEEYFRPPSQTTTEILISGDMNLRDLEAQLDKSFPSSKKDNAVRRILTGSSRDSDIDTATTDHERTSGHQDKIKTKIGEILSHPQVRKKFEEELEREIGFYQASRRPMRKVRDIDRVTGKLRQAIYRLYLSSKRDHGKLVQSAADQIASFQGKLDELESTKRGIEQTASPETLGYFETQKLLEYKKQLREHGFVTTPSREQLIDRITREALAGKKIFLVGSTGTGKTELAFYALDSLTGGYEIVPWHEGTTPRDIFGYRELYEDAEGKVQSGIKPGPYPRALEKQFGLVHEEFTGGSTRTHLSMKYLMGAHPGEKVHIPGFNGEVHEITPNFIELFTGNPKDERTKQREEMDPAILRELTGVEVSYMPASEMKDIILAKLIEENGVLRLGQTELKYIEQLCKAAEMMQKIHNRDFEGFTPEIKAILGIDAQGNTETTLNTNFLDPGTLFKLFGEWELARARGQNFGEYMQSKLGEFVRDPKTLSTPEEQKTLQKVLHAFGLVSSASGETEVAIGKPEGEKGYTLPSEMAGAVALSSENPMGAKSTETRQPITSELQRTEQEYWSSFLGVQAEVSPLPTEVTRDVVEKLKDLGMEIRSLPKLDIGTLDDLKKMGTQAFLARIEQKYPGLKVLYKSLSGSNRQNHSIRPLLDKRYWDWVKDGITAFPDGYNKGGWLAVETMSKPAYGTSYATTLLSQKLGFLNRFNVSAEKADRAVREQTASILTDSGLPNNRSVRMPTAEEWNLLAYREGWDATNNTCYDTWEWTNTEADLDGASRRVIVGVAPVTWSDPSRSFAYIGFRVVVVLGT